MDMGIVNAGMLQVYSDIPADLLEVVEEHHPLVHHLLPVVRHHLLVVERLAP
jgi:hypothetical protein